MSNPEWYEGSGLTFQSDKRAMQAWLHTQPNNEGCNLLPCVDLSSLSLLFYPRLGTDPKAPPPPPGFCDDGVSLSDRMGSLSVRILSRPARLFCITDTLSDVSLRAGRVLGL